MTDLYRSNIIKAEELIIKQQNLGFITDLCSVVKLMYSHILLHCKENIDIFTDEEKVNINYLISKSLI